MSMAVTPNHHSDNDGCYSDASYKEIGGFNDDHSSSVFFPRNSGVLPPKKKWAKNPRNSGFFFGSHKWS